MHVHQSNNSIAGVSTSTARDRTTRSLRVTLLAAAGASILSALPAVAQEEEETIVVTGSRIARAEITSVSPITVIGAGELEARGVSQFENFVDQLTFAPGGETNSRVNNGQYGLGTISLRGLGPQRTLLLINGRRATPSSVDGYTDVNTIPVSLIGSVEVLRDGASTVYGSDAVAGVVNILTKQVEGFEAFAQHDRTDEDDGEIYRYGASIGQSFDGGRFTLNAEYMDRDVILQGDRAFSACPLSEENGMLVCGGSGTAYPAQISPTLTDSALYDIDPDASGFVLDPSTGELRAFTATDGYNFAERSYMVTPQEVWSFFGDAEYDLFDSDTFGSVTAFLEGSFAHRVSQQQLAPVGTFWSPIVPAYHPDNPVGEPVAVSRRLAELENGRFYTQDAETWRTVFGLEGTIPSGIGWDASLSYGRYTDARVEEGQANPVRADEVLCLDPASVALGACATTPSLIWDPFRVDTLTDEIANYMLVKHSPVSRQTLLVSQANVYGDLGVLELPGGPIDWAVGYEHRRQTGQYIPDGAAQLGQIYFVSGEATDGEITSTEFYGETRLPLIADAPFAELVAVELSVRSSNYDVKGTGVDSSFDANTYKVAGEWAPVEDFRLRATYSTGFRAPSIGELFSPQRQSAVQYTDPCVNWASNPTITPEALANCQADGVPGGFTLTSTQAQAVLGGNPNLAPEESEGYTVGAVFTPTRFDALSGFSATIDYWAFEITDAIGSADVNTIVQTCYDSAGFSDPLCDLIQGPSYPIVNASPYPGPGGARRNAVGVISGVLQSNANLSSYETSGVDFGIDYETGSFGIFNSSANAVFGLDATWLEKYDYTVLPGDDPLEYAGSFAQDPFTGSPAAFPEWSATATAGVVGDAWSFTWVGRYIGETEDFSSNPANLDNVADAIFYHDVQASWTVSNTELAIGVRNLLDEDPPYVTNNDDMNTLMQTYETAGRYFYGRVTLRM